MSGRYLDSEPVTYNGTTYDAKKILLRTETLQIRINDNRVLQDEVVNVEFLIIDGIGVYSEYVTINDGSGTPIIEHFVLK